MRRCAPENTFLDSRLRGNDGDFRMHWNDRRQLEFARLRGNDGKRKRRKNKYSGKISVWRIRAGDFSPQISPLRVAFLDQADFPSPIPFFDLLFARDGFLHRNMLLVVCQ
jgi:hypothetical protein